MSKLLYSLVGSPDSVQGPVSHSSAPGSEPIGRPDTETSQHVEVGIVLNDVLGQSCAADYLARHHVQASVAQRVLEHPEKRRPSPKTPPSMQG